MDQAEIDDLFGAFGPVKLRRLFGGAGLYADGVMFGLDAGGALYLKADAAFAEELARRGSEPFSYQARTGWRTVASFWRLPDAALDDAEDLAALARRALAIARALAQPGREGQGKRRPAKRRASAKE